MTVKEEGYDYFYEFVPGMKEHYPSFVTVLGDLSKMDCRCRNGSGGPPNCAIRSCAKEKGVFVCMDCVQFPCDRLAPIMKVYPLLSADAARYKEVGKEKWLEELKGREAKGFFYGMVRKIEAPSSPTDGKQEG